MTILDWIKEIKINKRKWQLFSDSEKTSFNTYIINRWLSMDINLIELVNIIQKYSKLLPKFVYEIYSDLIPKTNRYTPYIKKKKILPHKNIEIISKHYNISQYEASEYLDIMTTEEIKEIISLYGIK